MNKQYEALRSSILSAPHHFALLGVHASSTPQEIREARRRLAMHFHPDINRSADAADLIARVNVAHHTLTGDRAKYMATLGKECIRCGGRGALTKQLSFTKTKLTICTKCQGSGRA